MFLEKISEMCQRMKISCLYDLLDIHLHEVIFRISVLTKAEIAEMFCGIICCHRDMVEENLNLLEENNILKEDNFELAQKCAQLEKEVKRRENTIRNLQNDIDLTTSQMMSILVDKHSKRRKSKKTRLSQILCKLPVAM